jgi:ribosomal protein S24E
MKVNIISKKHNPLLKRREVTFSVEHHDQTGGTPTRALVKSQLASIIGTSVELVFIINMRTKTGTMLAQGKANVYESIEQAKLVEPDHVINKNAAKAKAAKPKEDEEESDEDEEEE